MKTYAEIVREDRRLAILRFLSEDNDYAINDSVMQKALEQLGHSVSRDVLRADFASLQELGLLSVDYVLDGKVHLAKITGRGLDVAAGRSVVPGVSRPRPE